MAVRISASGIRAFLRGSVADFVGAVGTAVRRRAERTAPVDTGRLRRTMTQTRVRFRGNTAYVKVGTNTGYGLFPEEGTGIYGPKNQVIRPKRAPFLVFQPKGLSHVIRTRFVRGQRGQHYMRDALIAVVKKL